MNIVESIEEINQLKEKLETEVSIWYPLWVDNSKHPLNTSLSLVVVRCSDGLYILPHTHTDALSLSIEQIETILNTNGQKWVFQKKKILHTLRVSVNLYDVDSAYFRKEAKVIDYEAPLNPLLSTLTHKGYRDDLIQSLPLMKIVEVIEPQFGKYFHNEPYTTTLKWYNEVFIPTLSDIEQFGIRVDGKKFIDRWSSNDKQLKEDNVYTEYNPYTITSRPSNRHGGINFGALNKSDGSRDVFIPRKGKMFLQFDYDAYHVRIIGKLIKYNLPKTSVHQWLADQYGCEYDDSKGRTFRILYGGVSDEDKKIPFFDKVDKFIQRMQEESIRNGYLQTPKGRKIPLGWIEQPTAQKYFNYILQATETEFNIEAMSKLKKERLPLPILYTYDSFLFQFDDSDIETIKKVKAVLESFGFPVKADWGTDYGKL